MGRITNELREFHAPPSLPGCAVLAFRRSSLMQRRLYTIAVANQGAFLWHICVISEVVAVDRESWLSHLPKTKSLRSTKGGQDLAQSMSSPATASTAQHAFIMALEFMDATTSSTVILSNSNMPIFGLSVFGRRNGVK
jgi:hypothetical protein